MDRTRLTSVIVCIALLGFTLTPAAYYPCCCTYGTPSPAGKVNACCCAEQKQTPVCCADAGDATRLLCKMAYQPIRPDCHCLEKIQRVGLIEVQIKPAPARVPLVFAAAPTCDLVHAFIGTWDRPFAADGQSLSIPVKNCSLLL